MLLHLDLQVLGDLDGYEIVTDLVNAPEDTAISNNFITLAERFEHRLMLLRLLGLGTDQDEIKDGDKNDHHDDKGSAAALLWRRLCPGIVYEKIQHLE